MADLVRVQVLMPRAEAERFEAFCRARGYKKSPLIARLVREHLDMEGYATQPDLFDRERRETKDE